MKKFFAAALTAFFATNAISFAAPAEKETINQIALLQSLALGHFDGSISVKDLKKIGDTGIGTFDGLDGEMIFLEGTVYRANQNCKINVVDDAVTIPFSNVTFFEKDFSVDLKNISGKIALENKLNELVKKNGENSFYMIKINATFDEILVRSEKGSKKPYPTLVKASEKPKMIRFQNKKIFFLDALQTTKPQNFIGKKWGFDIFYWLLLRQLPAIKNSSEIFYNVPKILSPASPSPGTI